MTCSPCWQRDNIRSVCSSLAVFKFTSAKTNIKSKRLTCAVKGFCWSADALHLKHWNPLIILDVLCKILNAEHNISASQPVRGITDETNQPDDKSQPMMTVFKFCFFTKQQRYFHSQDCWFLLNVCRRTWTQMTWKISPDPCEASVWAGAEHLDFLKCLLRAD